MIGKNIIVCGGCIFILAALVFYVQNIDKNEEQKINISGEQYLFSNKSLPKDLNVLDMAVGDVDNDFIEEVLILSREDNSKYGKDFIIYKPVIRDNRVYLHKEYAADLSQIKPWKIEICEIDGDGYKEIFMGVYKTTVFYPEEENRPFFFSYKDKKLIKKWTGSKVRNPFIDVCFADINLNGIDEFIVVERNQKGNHIVAAYYWHGFGFILLAESGPFDEIVEIDSLTMEEKEYIEIIVNQNGIQEKIILQLKNQALKEKGG